VGKKRLSQVVGLLLKLNRCTAECDLNIILLIVELELNYDLIEWEGLSMITSYQVISSNSVQESYQLSGEFCFSQSQHI
jgi:hypothetical protein